MECFPTAAGNDFLALRTAFGPLHAPAAITSAWHDNHASLGVSRARR